VIMSPARLGTEDDCDGEGSAPIINDRPIFSSERKIHKGYDHKRSVEKNTGCESQGACCQDKLIGGKPLVVK
jgi:hypothetical protein